MTTENFIWMSFISVVVTLWVTFFAKYEVNRSNRNGATERTRQKLKRGDLDFRRPVWPWPLTFGSEDGAMHIVILWVILLPIMKRFGQIHVGTERWSRQDNNFERLMWPWLWPFDLGTHTSHIYHRVHVWCKFNRFRYINNNVTKDRCPIPMDTTVGLVPLNLAYGLL